jgi:hypothetical protein
MQSHNQRNDSTLESAMPDISSPNTGDGDQAWNDSAAIMVEMCQKRVDQVNEGELLQIAAEIIMGSDDCDGAMLVADKWGYVVAGSTGIETIFKMPLQLILYRDIITLFTEENFQQELSVYLKDDNAAAVNLKNLKQKTHAGTLFLDVTIQRLYRSRSDHIGFLCLAKDASKYWDFFTQQEQRAGT